jgi:siroheme synthase
LHGSTPAAVIQDASLPRERQLRTTLDRLAVDIAEHEIESPAIMVIGEVAREKNIDAKDAMEQCMRNVRAPAPDSAFEPLPHLAIVD